MQIARRQVPLSLITQGSLFVVHLEGRSNELLYFIVFGSSCLCHGAIEGYSPWASTIQGGVRALECRTRPLCQR